MKPYDQYCPVAHALDLVGDRWALLVVRELQHGPQRYSDLHERLARCSTNVLASRLKELEGGGVVSRRRLPPPAASTVYELTDDGAALAPVLAALARFGARTLGPPPDDLVDEPGWLERALRTAVAAFATDTRIAFEIGEERASLDGALVVPGVIEGADAHVRGTPADFYALFVLGRLDGAEISGDRAAVERLVGAVAPAQPVG